VDGGAGANCGVGQPTSIAKGIERTAPSIKRAAKVTVRAGRARDRFALKQFDWRSPFLPRHCGLAKKLGRTLRESGANRAALVCLTSDLKLSNKGEDSVRSAARERHHSSSQIAAEMALYFLRFML
jgi:hypothetical protein